MPPDELYDQDNHRYDKQQDADPVHPMHHCHIIRLGRVGIFFLYIEIPQYLLPDAFHSVKIVKTLVC
jgi:hypothetical protein